MKPLHEVRDEKKLKELTENMVENGWQGAPLVHIQSNLLTGSHRSVAAKLAGITPEYIELKDLIIENCSTTSDEYDEALEFWAEHTNDIVELANSVMREFGLKWQVKEQYGIEIK